MQIQSVILYSNDGRVRELRLRPNSVNVITGGSRTGKTALLDIIDYCTGRNPCNVPAGVIRSKVSWFAVVLSFPEGPVFVARRCPGPTASTSPDIMIDIGRDAAPAVGELLPNITRDGLLEQLDRLLGIIPNEHVPPAGQTRRPLHATVDHAKFLVFQGQSEIASREFLFHRQGEPFIPQAIRDSLPFFLGAVQDEAILMRSRLRDAKRELQQLDRARAEAERVVGAGAARADSLLAEAREAGLIGEAEQGDARRLLVRASAPVAQTPDRPITGFGTEASRIRDQLTNLRTRYQELQAQSDAAVAFNNAQLTYAREATEQAARLETVGLLPQEENAGGSCPLCQSRLDTPVPAANDLQNSLQDLREELNAIGTRRPRVDLHIVSIQEQQQALRQEMAGLRNQLGAIEAQERQVAVAASLEARQSRVAGRISLYLESVPEAQADTAAAERAERLRAEIARLEEQLADDAVQESVASALNRVSAWMTEGARALNLEYQPNPYRLDLSQLTVIADTDQRPVRMNQMGSAENWLGCHLISHIALHRWFVLRRRPVPRFLFIDQPTSAYYPPDDPTQGRDEDRAAVRRMYSWLINQTPETVPGFQLIIVDHADLEDDWFQRSVVERWRGDEALVPPDWIRH